MLLIGFGQASAQANVTAVKGSAFGYECVVSTVFRSNCSPAVKTPLVTLAADASNSPQTATVATGNASAGPATIFSSLQIDVSTQGTLGASGSVTSSTNIATVNASTNEVFTAANLASTCTASETAVSASTTITGGTLRTDNGDSDSTNTIPNHPPVDVALPASPAPATFYAGHIHIGSQTDNFNYTFNEQVINADGSITVNAAHERLLGPLATGNLILGQVVCGVTVPPPPPASADLAITLSDSPDPVAVRGDVTYTVNVTNSGPDTATGVTVLSSISKGARFISATGATCTAVKGKDPGVSCDLGSIASGGAATQFMMVVRAGRTPVSVTSTVSSSANDPVSTNNSDTEATAIAP